jgi:hypothetical protein
MFVVSLAGLVVVAQDACAIDDQSQPVFVAVRAAAQRLWHLPDDKLGEGILLEPDACRKQGYRSDHVSTFPRLM